MKRSEERRFDGANTLQELRLKGHHRCPQMEAAQAGRNPINKIRLEARGGQVIATQVYYGDKEPHRVTECEFCGQKLDTAFRT
jgi:hypothetical protein